MVSCIAYLELTAGCTEVSQSTAATFGGPDWVRAFGQAPQADSSQMVCGRMPSEPIAVCHLRELEFPFPPADSLSALSTMPRFFGELGSG